MKTRSRFQRLADKTVYFLVILSTSIVTWLGPAVGYVLIRLLGLLWYGLLPSRRAIMKTNLDLAFGDSMTDLEKRRLMRRCCQHSLAVPLESLLSGRLLKNEEAAHRYIKPCPELIEYLKAKHPNGILMLTAHFGSWEIGFDYVCMNGVPAHPVMRTLDNPHLDQLAVRQRTRHGHKVIRKRGALLGIIKALKRGHCVALMPDQNASRHGSFYDFLGVPASTHTGYAEMAAKLGSDVVCIGLHRSQGLRFQFEFDYEVMQIDPALSFDETVDTIVKNYVSFLEKLVRAHPEQYVWMHRRWKTRPHGEPSFYASKRR